MAQTNDRQCGPAAGDVARCLAKLFTSCRASLRAAPRAPSRDYRLNLACACVALAALALSRTPHLRLGLSVGPAPLLGSDRAYLDDASPSSRGERRSLSAGQSELLVREPVVHTEAGFYPVYSIGVHEVVEGETLETIAGELGLDPKTVFWANNDQLSSAEALAGGQQLRVLPLNGAYYVVAPGDTVESVAAAHGVPPQDITDYKGNAIPESGELQVGQALVIPGAALPEIPLPTPVVETSSLGLIWPVGGYVSQYYHSSHLAIDIAGSSGDPIIAAADGVVVLTAWQAGGYGNYIIIEHPSGLETLYAHLSEVDVEVGQSVSQGEVIGLRGTTGRSTGPHLHFEVRDGGNKLDPLACLP